MFTQLPSYKTLAAKAARPLDMARALTPERIRTMAVSGVGFKLLYAAERVDEPVITALLSLAREAHAPEQMAAMQAGEVINRIKGVESENRSVLHTAMRDQFDHPQTAKPAREAAAMAAAELAKLERFLHVVMTDADPAESRVLGESRQQF